MSSRSIFHVFYSVKYTRSKTRVFFDIYSNLRRQRPKMGAGSCLRQFCKCLKSTCFLAYFWQLPGKLSHFMCIFEKGYPATARV